MGEIKSSLLKDISSGIKKYPSLTLEFKDKQPIVKGSFPAHQNDLFIQRYDVTIGFPPNYPNYMPWVIETGGKIPRTADRHVFSIDNTLCFGNLTDLLRECKKGITFVWFLDNILNKHLCREYVRDKLGYYLDGERNHGQEGNWESYYDIFGHDDKKQILSELFRILENKDYPLNKKCYCGSQKKYKRCHAQFEKRILDIGRTNLRMIYNLLKTDIKIHPKTSS